MELSENAKKVAESRYFWEGETKWSDLVERICKENARNEKNSDKWYEEFYSVVEPMDFIPAGRILRNLGKLRPSTSNCNFLPIDDSIESIGDTLKNYLIISSYGGGNGINFSSLRPKNVPLKTKGGKASGMTSFIEMFNSAGKKIETGGQRRAAGIALCDISHPDIYDFINAKTKEDRITQFNISVLVNEEFLEAVESNTDWDLKFAGQVFKTIKAREIWDLVLDNMLKYSEPGLINWDNLIKNNSFYFAPIRGCNPCGEQPLENFGVCNLAALVLPHFIVNKNTDWKKLSRTIKLGVRFLDNIIDLAYYPIPQQETVVKNARRLGLGTMGLSDYLFMKEIRYGSEKAIAEIDKLYKFIRDETYIASVDLAKEKGAFPKYDKVEYSKASFVRKLPAKIRMYIKDNSIRNVTLLTAAPTGCLVDGTLVSSKIGFKKIEDYKEINSRIGRGGVSTKSDFEDVHIKAYYDQGFAKTKSIKTKHGYELQGTFDHKVRVLTDGNGYNWKGLGDVEKGDIVVLKRGFLYNKKQTWLSNYKAELLGYYMADGWWTVSGRAHKLFFETSNSNEAEYISDLISKSFGSTFRIKVYKRNRSGSKSIRLEVNSKELYDWFQKYKCIKAGAIAAFIPDVVLSGSLDNIVSFVRGYHTGDEHVRKEDKRVGFTSISKTMATQLQIVLLGLGFISHLIEEKPDSYSIINGREISSDNKIYRISVNRYNSSKLLKLLYDIDIPLPKNGDRELIILTPDEMINFNRQHLSYTRDLFLSNNNVVCATKTKYCSKIKDMNWFVKNDLCFDVVAETNTYDNIHVNDLEVYEHSHTYIANGFITHNSTSLLADVVGGIEPLPFKGFRRVDGVGERVYIHPLSELHYDSDWFVDSYDLKPEEHLETQAVLQKYIDSGVSKTILLPKNTTTSDLSRLLLEYIHDIKGVTVYRDESREKQVFYRLNRKEIEKLLKDNKTTQAMSEDDVQCKSGKCDL